MAAITTLKDVESFPYDIAATLADGTWQEVQLPRASGFKAFSVKVDGDAHITFHTVTDGASVSGDYWPLASTDVGLRWPVSDKTGQRITSIFLAGNGGTPKAYIHAEGG
jgi:hypothetical protein